MTINFMAKIIVRQKCIITNIIIYVMEPYGGGMVLGSSHVSETTRVPFLAPIKILTLLY